MLFVEPGRVFKANQRTDVKRAGSIKDDDPLLSPIRADDQKWLHDGQTDGANRDERPDARGQGRVDE